MKQRLFLARFTERFVKCQLEHLTKNVEATQDTGAFFSEPSKRTKKKKRKYLVDTNFVRGVPCAVCRQSQVVGTTGAVQPSGGVQHGQHLSPLGSSVAVGIGGGGSGSGPNNGSGVSGGGGGGGGVVQTAGGGRSPAGGVGPPVIAGAQHLGQPLYQEYAHAVRPRAHPVPPPVYVTAAPSQPPQQQQLPTYQGFTPGWVPRHLVDACTCVPLLLLPIY